MSVWGGIGRNGFLSLIFDPHLLLTPQTEKAWKRVVTKHTFVGEGFTRKPPKYERFIRPMALRVKKAHVTHPEVGYYFCGLDFLMLSCGC